MTKLLPIKLHLKDWESKLHLTEKNDGDQFERRLNKTKEEKFDKLIEQLYNMEWKKMKQENVAEFKYMKDNVFRKIQ